MKRGKNKREALGEIVSMLLDLMTRALKRKLLIICPKGTVRSLAVVPAPVVCIELAALVEAVDTVALDGLREYAVQDRAVPFEGP